MKDIVFVFNPGCYPVPAINGGAVEALITTLIEENEIQQKFNFHVIMCKHNTDTTKYDYSNFKFTKFYDFYQSDFAFKINRIVNGVNKRLNYALPLYSKYEKFMLKTIENINPEFIIFEGSFNSTLRKLRKKYDKDKLIFHVHHRIEDKKRIDKFFGRMWCVSEYIKKDWKASKILDENFKYQVLNNVLTSKTFNNELSLEERKTLMKKYNFNDDDFVVVYCGRLVKVKGIDVLIKAVKEINIQNLKLLIIGESGFKNSNVTPFVEAIKNLIGEDNRFVFTGFVDNKELFKYYSLANLQVIPSVWEEVAGIVALEGRAVGLPQIVTNSGGLTEYASKNAIVLDKSNDLLGQLKTEILKFYNKEYENITVEKENISGAKEYYIQFEELINK